jgi:AcrR family transcriptional regulator
MTVTRDRLVPGTLSRQRIVDVALDLADREGPEALSMRRIAAELGTGTMSLYNHVPDKATLLNAVAERVLAEIELPADGTWEDMARAWAGGLRAALLGHRAVALVVISVNEARPLVAASRALVHALQRAGLHPHDARMVMRVVGRYAAGAIFLDTAVLRRPSTDQAPLDRYFAFGLDALLEGLAARTGAARSGTAGGSEPDDGDPEGRDPGTPAADGAVTPPS